MSLSNIRGHLPLTTKITETSESPSRHAKTSRRVPAFMARAGPRLHFFKCNGHAFRNAWRRLARGVWCPILQEAGFAGDLKRLFRVQLVLEISTMKSWPKQIEPSTLNRLGPDSNWTCMDHTKQCLDLPITWSACVCVLQVSQVCARAKLYAIKKHVDFDIFGRSKSRLVEHPNFNIAGVLHRKKKAIAATKTLRPKMTKDSDHVSW